MQRIARAFGLVVAIAIAAPTVMVAQHADTAAFDGTWEVTFASQMGEQRFVMELTVDHGSITGTAETVMGTMPVDGTQEGAELAFSVDLVAPDHEVVLLFTGELDGDAASGMLDIMGESFSWTGERVDP